MFDAYADRLQSQIPERPGAYYAHLVVLRRTDSYAVFKTDGELNTAHVQAGLDGEEKMTRLTIFKRKQTTPERLTGRELLRRYGIHDQIRAELERNCTYNVEFCGVCPDCVTYGYAIGDTGSEKSKVYSDTAYSLTSYDDSHESFTLNAPFEDGTMTREGATTNRFSEQDHVKPEIYFPSVMTLRDPTALGLAYVINNVRRSKLYGAQTTRTGRMDNRIMALIFADGEIFSNLKLTQKVHDLTKGKGDIPAAVLTAAQELVQKDGVTFKIVQGAELDALLHELDATFTDADELKTFLQNYAAQTREYAERIGVGAPKKAKAGKAKK